MHPVQFDLDYEIDRNRLTTFFRLIVAIPWIVWLYLYGIVAFVAAVIAWFAMLFTKRYPESLYDFIGGYVKLSTQVGGFIVLATDEFPPFLPDDSRDYPVHVAVAPRQIEHRRAHTFFKYVLAFPQQVILFGLGYMLMGASFVTWWRVLFTGKQSATMHDAIRTGLAYSARSNGFLLLLTETHPRLLDLPPQEYPPDAPALPGPEQMLESGSGTAVQQQPPPQA
jgi:hypothetical protein